LADVIGKLVGVGFVGRGVVEGCVWLVFFGSSGGGSSFCVGTAVFGKVGPGFNVCEGVGCGGVWVGVGEDVGVGGVADVGT